MSKCQKSHDRDNSWCDCGSTGRRARGGRISKHSNKKSRSHADDGYKQIHTGCYFFQVSTIPLTASTGLSLPPHQPKAPLNIAGLSVASEVVPPDCAQASARVLY